jgi:hypothetical protein
MTGQFDIFEQPPEMRERKSTVSAFKLGDTIFECWVTADNSYVWRSTCGRFAAWRDARLFRASVGDRVSKREYNSLVTAMAAAIANKDRT